MYFLVGILGALVAKRILVDKKTVAQVNEYKEQKEKYDILVEQDALRVKKEVQKKRNIDTQIVALKNNRSNILYTLKRLYDMNVVYPKYRNFIAVATFYEYFESGRCAELEGHEGAYNIYENELRLNAVLGKLDDIINHLEEIRSTQYTIYTAIKEGNKMANAIYKKSESISDNMKSIADNTAISAYNNEITARNTEILKFIALYDHM